MDDLRSVRGSGALAVGRIGDYLRYVDINASVSPAMPGSNPSPALAPPLGCPTLPVSWWLRRIVRALELYSHDVRRTYGLTAPQLWASRPWRRPALTTGQLARVLLDSSQQRFSAGGSVGAARTGQPVRLQNDRRFVRIELTERAVNLCAVAPEPTQGRLLHGLGGCPATAPRHSKGGR